VLGGRYCVEGLLGRGGGGMVYRALDRRSGQRVALKHRRRDVGAEALNAFEREFHILAGLSHPFLVKVHDYGVDGEDAFYTMELLDGHDLRGAGPLPYRQVATLLRDVCAALDVLHSRRLLHRDVSASNVRRAADGHAKLFDFGSMTPMGPVQRASGTPPFIPPEVMELQTLDARADLYAVGVLGYYLLTGRYPYPASSIEALPDAWRRPPVPPRKELPELPEGLDQLVLELLHLDRDARPASAAGVAERLTGLAGLAPADHVARSYLPSPALVGRDAQTRAVREHLSSGLRGGVFIFEGAEGSGRTRLLDACVLEAKLLGYTVLRADGGEGAQGEHGLARGLIAQLDGEWPRAAQGVPRAVVQQQLRARLQVSSRLRPLVIAVDDFERSDESSAALLAALMHDAADHPITLVTTTSPPSGAAPGSPLQILRERAESLPLSPLEPAETEELLRSLFGDVHHVTGVAARIHVLSEGKPGFIVGLAEHLVERGIARYEAGSWALPRELGGDALPSSVESAWSARLDGLSPDARALAGALALTRAEIIAPERYQELLPQGDAPRAHAALADLLAARVLVPQGSRHAFAHDELQRRAAATVPQSQLADTHGRIARTLGDAEAPILRPHHLLRSGDGRAAIELLLALRAQPPSTPSRALLDLLDEALRCDAGRRARPTERLELQVWLVEAAALLGEEGVFRRHAEALLCRLERDSGIADLAELPDRMDEMERAVEALGRAQRRHEAAPEPERGWSPVDALTQLARLCGSFTSMSTMAQDVSLIERLPRLSGFAVLSPPLGLVDRVVQSMCAFQSGRFEDATTLFEGILRRLDEPDRAGLDDVGYRAMRLGGVYMLGVSYSARGRPDAVANLQAVEQEPGHRVNAWRVRMTHELMQGDMVAADQCRRRAELLHLQDGGALPYPGSTARIEMLAHLCCDDAVGVKRCMESLAATAARYPRWEPTARIARAHYLHLRGESGRALEVLQPALEAISPGRHMDWAFAVAAELQLLIALGRHAEAAEKGREYLGICERERLFPTHRTIMRGLAEALCRLGELDEALSLIETCLEQTLADGSRGMSVGLVYETRARIALAMHDEQAFLENAQRCAEQFRRGTNPGLGAKYERLMRDAEAGDIALTSALRRALEEGIPGPPRALRSVLDSPSSDGTDASVEEQTLAG
jgi:serine/threonine-protein kinase